MELKEQELGNLGVENRKRLALQEEENAARKNVFEEKCRQLERLETVKKMNAAKTRLQVYEHEVGSDEEISELLHSSNHVKTESKTTQRSLSVHHVATPQNATCATCYGETDC